jgi:hypothetical protein
LGHNKKLFTTLFVLFVAVISSVAGGFALTNPNKVRSEAKGHDGASLTIYFYLNGGSGTAENISKSWGANEKSDASSSVAGLKVPNNHEEFEWLQDVDHMENDKWIEAHYETESDSEGGSYQKWVDGYWTQKKVTVPELVLGRKLTFNFDKAGYVFTGWVEGTASGPSSQGKVYEVDGDLASSETGNVVKHLHAKWEPIFFNISFAADAKSPTTANCLNATVSGVSWASYSVNMDGSPAASSIILPEFDGTDKTGHTFVGWLPSKAVGNGAWHQKEVLWLF